MVRRTALILALASAAVAHGASPVEARSAICQSDADCDDGLFCNGDERCAPAEPGAGRDGCVSDPAPCAGIYCDEALDQCTTCPPGTGDKDGDGHISIACGGDDCDDDDPNRFPGNTEVCDPLHVDEDCDPTTFGLRDADGDGFYDAACCNFDGDTKYCGDDCDDSAPGVNPMVPEVCNGIDDDCDGEIDEGVALPLYEDRDGDGFGAAGSLPADACFGTAGFSPYNNDCDDQNPAIIPGAMICGGDPGEVLVCTGDGTYAAKSCPRDPPTMCIAQPNGTGTCYPVASTAPPATAAPTRPPASRSAPPAVAPVPRSASSATGPAIGPAPPPAIGPEPPPRVAPVVRPSPPASAAPSAGAAAQPVDAGSRLSSSS